MDVLIQSLIEKAASFSEGQLRQLNEFAEFLQYQESHKSLALADRESASEQQLPPDEFGKRLNDLAKGISALRGQDAPPLSDYAVSREGIYGDHP